MDEMTLVLASRTRRGRFNAARATRQRVILFERADRVVVATPLETGQIAALRLDFEPGAQFLLHALAIRTPEGKDLFRWAGSGELFRQMQGLRLSRHDGAVRIESHEAGGGLTLELDPALSGPSLQLLLTVSSAVAGLPPAERAPDRIGGALDRLHERIENLDLRTQDLDLRMSAAQERLQAETRMRHAELTEGLEALRGQSQQQHEQLIGLLHREHARNAQLEAQLAQARDLVSGQAGRIGALETSTSWRVTAPLRVLVRLVSGRQSMTRVTRKLASLRGRRHPAPAAESPAEPSEPSAERPEPRPVAFPLPGAAAVVGELAERPPEPLPLKVSVIVPTYNAGAEFYWLLRKLQGQQGLAGIEVVVVDSGSADGTAELAESFGCTVVRIPNSEFSHSHARNLGADNATGDLLLFTVQDAYPVGDWWLHSLARALSEPWPDGGRPAAVSCSEFPRRDSELLYNAAVDTHYRFLECREGDRLGAYLDDGHMSLRVQGQLSDVACLILAETFAKYRYQGRYAEDLILGVRLLKDGLKPAMLSSVKVVHSHNRPAAYHLKRTFVDVVFLTEVFPDFPIPGANSPGSAAAAASLLSFVTEAWRPEVGADAATELRRFARQVRGAAVSGTPAAPVDFGFAGLQPWLATEIAEEKSRDPADAEQLRNMFADRLDHLAQFLERTYGACDDHLASELAQAVRKTLAATFGAQLAFLYLNQAGRGPKRRQARIDALRTLMTAGI